MTARTDLVHCRRGAHASAFSARPARSARARSICSSATRRGIRSRRSARNATPTALATLARDLDARFAAVADRTCLPRAEGRAGRHRHRGAPARRAVIEAARTARPIGSWRRSAARPVLSRRSRRVERGARSRSPTRNAWSAPARLFMRARRDRGATVLPVDSEHNALFQALAAGRREDVSADRS